MATRQTNNHKKDRAKKKIRDRKNYYRLLGIVFIMILFGMVMVLSASSVRAIASNGDAYYYIKKQLISVIIGSAALFIFSQIPSSKLQKFAPHAIFITLAMLVAVLVPGIGKHMGGSSRWIPIGGFHLQPSEIAKIAVVLYTADFLSKRKNNLSDMKDLVYPYGLIIAAIALLVLKQPDLGTTVTICLAAFTLIFIGGVSLRYVATIGITGLIAGTYAIYSSKYRFKRFAAFLNPEADPLGAGYHIRQGLIAFGSGGIFGVGLGMSRQKYFYLPAAHTDFIFAIIGEELGLLGTLFTVLLFAAFTYYGIRISFQSKNLFSRLLGAGFTSMIALQALINMGAVTAVLPITGIPMPFISYGGSSLIVNLAAVGMLLGIALENEKEASLRERAPRLHAIVKEGSGGRKKPIKVSRTIREASKKRASAGSSKVKAASSTRSAKTSKSKSAKKESAKSNARKTRRVKANAGSNKRRRNSRPHLSRAGSRQSTSKNKGRS